MAIFVRTAARLFLAAVALLGLLALVSARAYAEEFPSYWTHNGSIMGLRVQGKSRTFVFVKPREGLPVRPGMILFYGTSDGSNYMGIARRFTQGMIPTEYPVTGPIENNFSRVTLRGQAVVRYQNGTKKTFDDILVFDVIRNK